MIQKKELAKQAFYNGYNCAQTVLKSFKNEFDFDDVMAMGMSAGFGGGMGKMQKTCGAVTGAFMVLGLYCAQKYSDNIMIKQETGTMSAAFHQKFLELNNTSNCIELLKTSLNTREGKKYYDQQNLRQKVCQKCIYDAIDIVEGIIKKDKKDL
ncbi:MAG: C-GCAxxG-C-C family protein [Bacteroidota bacterium]